MAPDTPNGLIDIYLGLDWALTPAEGKRAINQDWGDDRLTRQAAEVHLANGGTIGVVLGSASGTLDVECDDDDGEVKIKKVFGGRIPATPTFQSRRGPHRLFRYSPVFDKIDKAEVKIDGVEFRLGGSGAAMSLIPPSKTNGVVREWLPGLSPADVELAPLPQAVIKRLLLGQKGVGKQNGKPADGEIIPEGSRNDALTSLAGTMRRRGMTEQELYCALWGVNENR